MISNGSDKQIVYTEIIMTASRTFHANKKLLRRSFLSRNTKLNIHKTVIRSTMTYGPEIRMMKQKKQENLRIQERKLLGCILRPIKVSENDYRRRNNNETKSYQRILSAEEDVEVD